MTMKKLFSLVMMMLPMFGSVCMAQNLQVHYDFGRHIYSDDEPSRQAVTATFEQFKADNLGSWFYFIDLDVDNKGMAGAYTEISREFNFYKPCDNATLSAHVEYDGGLNRGGSFQQAGLVGAAWNGHNADFSKTYSLQVMYKQFFGDKEFGHDAYGSFQVTGVWGLNFADGKATFSGFADLWSEKQYWDGKRHLVFLAEPQLWYNVSSKFSVGTEVELSNNFIYSSKNGKNDKFYVNPTLAVKYNF